jgi:hypothetical protein
MMGEHVLKPPHKIDVPNFVFKNLKRTLILAWYVIRCGFKNGCQNAICLKEIGLHVQSMMSILIKLNDEHTWDDHLMSTKIFTLIMNKTFI